MVFTWHRFPQQLLLSSRIGCFLVSGFFRLTHFKLSVLLGYFMLFLWCGHLQLLWFRWASKSHGRSSTYACGVVSYVLERRNSPYWESRSQDCCCWKWSRGGCCSINGNTPVFKTCTAVIGRLLMPFTVSTKDILIDLKIPMWLTLIWRYWNSGLELFNSLNRSSDSSVLPFFVVCFRRNNRSVGRLRTPL